MNCQNQSQQVKSQVKQKYEWLSMGEINHCYNLALHDFVRYSYPSVNKRPDVNSVPIDFLTAQWLYERMVDILDRAGGASVTSYKENGISWTYGTSYIDPHLVSMIMPKARVPR